MDIYLILDSQICLSAECVCSCPMESGAEASENLETGPFLLRKNAGIAQMKIKWDERAKFHNIIRTPFPIVRFQTLVIFCVQVNF